MLKETSAFQSNSEDKSQSDAQEEAKVPSQEATAAPRRLPISTADRTAGYSLIGRHNHLTSDMPQSLQHSAACKQLQADFTHFARMNARKTLPVDEHCWHRELLGRLPKQLA